MLRWGFIYSIDFVGGSNVEYKLQKSVDLPSVKKIIAEQEIEAISLSEKDNILTLRAKPIDEKRELQLRKSLQKKLSLKVELLRFETVGPVLGAETVRKTVIASLIAIVGILIYMSISFRGIKFALSAILALIHDILVMVGVYSLLSHFFGAQVDTLFVTAVLTTMSFSVHDTIVIFDKIREYSRVEGVGNIKQFADKALTETMVRSLNNSMTIVFMLLALILMGGTTIRFFIIALLVGTITGTYSSPFVATPILALLEKSNKK